ncbi:MAG: tetratricopeptide repeat protein [Planctomycetales bacterium]|nr:tetratricopeptide repeat protein [Planctomycetales bacterium]
MPRTEAPRPFLTDFGLAKSVATGSKLTRTGQALGTPAYMSPEQARGESSELAPATDVWGLGCALYEMLLARPPYEGQTPAAVVARVLAAEPRSVAAERPDVPRSLERLLRVALAKRVAARYPDASALRDDLDRVLRGEAPRARPPGGPPWKLAAAALGAAALAGAAALLGIAGAILPTSGSLPPRPAAPSPSGAGPLAAKARALRDSDPATAAALYREALAAEPGRHEWRVERGLALWSVGRGAEAREDWSRVPAGVPERGAARLFLGLESAFSGRPAEALPDLEAAVTAGGRAAPLARATIEVLTDRQREARERLRNVSGWEASLLRGYVGEWDPDGDPAAQARDYEQALAGGPPLAWVHNNLGAARARLGDLAGALRSFDAGARLDPDFPKLLYNRANCLKEMGRYEEAREGLTSLLARHPEMPEAWLSRGHVVSTLGDPAAAIRDYTRALEISPGLSTAWIWRGTLRYQAGDLAGAERDCEAALRYEPDSAPSWYARGNLRHDLGDPAGARDDYTEAIRRRPDYPEALANRGAVRYELGETAGAIEDLRAALRHEREFEEVAAPFLSLSKILGETGRPEAAAETLRDYLSRHAGAPEAARARELLAQWEAAAAGRPR